VRKLKEIMEAKYFTKPSIKKFAFLPVIILGILIFSACQVGPSETPTIATPAWVSDTPTAQPTHTPLPSQVPDTPTAHLSALPSPTRNTPTPFSTPVLYPAKASVTPILDPNAINLILQPTAPISRPKEVIFNGSLECSLHGDFTKCVDKNIKIEFEYPAYWGKLEAELRTGGYSGYTYTYTFSARSTSEGFSPFASGLSKDFSEGREGTLSDFSGYDNHHGTMCDWHRLALFPICQKISSGVSWLIYYPDASYLCETAGMLGAGGKTPFIRIEIDLPNNPTINGLVFEAPFLSEQSSNQLESDLYPMLGPDPGTSPTNCAEENLQAFEVQRLIFLNRILSRSIDSDTLKHLDEMTHLAASIVFR
jgi:hypothetical protein